jgi:TrmH family RNA methyltransferase
MIININKSLTTLIKSLKDKKHRDEQGLFIIQGGKSVLEVISSNNCAVHTLLCTSDFFEENKNLTKSLNIKTLITSQDQLSELGSFQSNNTALAVCCKLNKKLKINEPMIAIDTVRDPGNFGTIIRTAHWFGILNIVCSPDTVELYNPKVLQACMGSFLHVNIVYTNLKNFLFTVNQPIFGTFTTGTNIYETIIPKNAIMVIGNESHGISPEVEKLIHSRISIPRVSENIDSLNVAVATGIVCGWWSITGY